MIQLREIAAGAVRSELRKQGDPRPETFDADSAWCVLDNLARDEPELVASWFYRNAPEPQVRLWFKEWRAWQRRMAT